MKTSQQGIVLIMVLLFLEIFTLLGIYAIKANGWEIKMAREYWQKQQRLEIAEQVLTDVEKNVAFANCQIAVTTGSALSHQSLAWWQKGCAGERGSFQYYYVVEPLGQDACAEVAKGVANYYRLSLLVVPNFNIRVKTILQSTVVVGSEQDAKCDGIPHVVKLGRQSWRMMI